MRRRTGRGFTLIETALAMLVIGLSILAIFGLGRHGLESSRETENEARCDRLADAVFESLQAYNAAFIEQINAETNGLSKIQQWYVRWNDVVTGKKDLPFPRQAGMWNLRTDPQPHLKFFNSVNADRIPAFDPDKIDLTEWNPFYQIVLTPEPESSVERAAYVPGLEDKIQVLFVLYPDGTTGSSPLKVFESLLIFHGGTP